MKRLSLHIAAVMALSSSCIPDPSEIEFVENDVVEETANSVQRPDDRVERATGDVDSPPDADDTSDDETDSDDASTSCVDLPETGCPSCIVEASEVCDDRNETNGDSCNPTCSLTNAVSTLMGGFDKPVGIATDGEYVYIVENGGCVVTSLKLSDGTSDVIAGERGSCDEADGRGADARFSKPVDVALLNGDLYVVDAGMDAIRRVDPETGEVSTLSRPGEDDEDDEESWLRVPKMTSITADGRFLYVAETDRPAILRVDPQTAEVSTVTGTNLKRPSGLATDGESLWVADADLHVIFAVELSTGRISTLAGRTGEDGHLDGRGTAARFMAPVGVAHATDGSLYVVAEDHTVRQIDLTDQSVTTLAGEPGSNELFDAVGRQARFDAPTAITSWGESPVLRLFVTGRDSGAARVIE